MVVRLDSPAQRRSAADSRTAPGRVGGHSRNTVDPDTAFLCRRLGRRHQRRSRGVPRVHGRLRRGQRTIRHRLALARGRRGAGSRRRGWLFGRAAPDRRSHGVSPSRRPIADDGCLESAQSASAHDRVRIGAGGSFCITVGRLRREGPAPGPEIERHPELGVLTAELRPLSRDVDPGVGSAGGLRRPVPTPGIRGHRQGALRGQRHHPGGHPEWRTGGQPLGPAPVDRRPGRNGPVDRRRRAGRLPRAPSPASRVARLGEPSDVQRATKHRRCPPARPAPRGAPGDPRGADGNPVRRRW